MLLLVPLARTNARRTAQAAMPVSSSTRTWRSGCVVPQCAQSHCRAAGASSPSARMASGIGIRRCKSRGTAARLVPARQQAAMAGSDDLAQLARQGARFRPLPRHRRVEPRLFVIEIEMPRDAAGTPRRGAELRHLLSRTAHRRLAAQPVGVNRRQRLVWDPRALRPLAGLGRAQRSCQLLLVHRSSSRAGLSTTIRARRR